MRQFLCMLALYALCIVMFHGKLSMCLNHTFVMLQRGPTAPTSDTESDNHILVSNSSQGT